MPATSLPPAPAVAAAPSLGRRLARWLVRRGWRWAVLLLGLAASGIAASFYYYQGVLHHHDYAYTASFYINGAMVQINAGPSGFAQYSQSTYALTLLLSSLGLALGVFLVRGKFSLRGLVLAMLLAGAAAAAPFACRPAGRGIKGTVNCHTAVPMSSNPVSVYARSLEVDLDPTRALGKLPAGLLKELDLPAEELVTDYAVDRDRYYHISMQSSVAHVFNYTFHPRLDARQVATLMEYLSQQAQAGIYATAREQGQPLQPPVGTVNLGGDWERWAAQDRQPAP